MSIHTPCLQALHYCWRKVIFSDAIVTNEQNYACGLIIFVLCNFIISYMTFYLTHNIMCFSVYYVLPHLTNLRALPSSDLVAKWQSICSVLGVATIHSLMLCAAVTDSKWWGISCNFWWRRWRLYKEGTCKNRAQFLLKITYLAIQKLAQQMKL